MALTVSLAITGIAIGLLVVYGADVMMGYFSDNKEGFIPFDHKTRGIGLGLPAMVLPIVGYVISRGEASKGLGVLIIIAGILIIVGGATVVAIAAIGNANPTEARESERDVVLEAMPIVIAGLIQIGLGILQIKKS